MKYKTGSSIYQQNNCSVSVWQHSIFIDVFKNWTSSGERQSTVAWLDHLLLVRTYVTINEVYSLKCLLEFVLFHNFCTMVKERDETRRTKYRRITQPVQLWSAVLFIDESAKRWQDFWGKCQYNQLCKRENILRNMCCGPWTTTDILNTQNPLQVCKIDKRSFVDAPYMVWLTAAETQFFPDEKPPIVA